MEKQEEINGMKVVFWQEGDGEAVLIIHGLGNRYSEFQTAGNILAQNGCRVYILDLPGFGESDTPSYPWSFSDYRIFLERFIRKLEIEKFHLISHSFGSHLALELAHFNADKVLSLTISNGVILRKRKFLKIPLSFLVFTFVYLALKPLHFLSGPIRSTNSFHAILRSRKLQPVRRYLSICRKKIVKNAVFFTKNNGVMRRIFYNIVQADTIEFAKKIKVPVLLLWGSNIVQITPQFTNGRTFQSAMPHARFVSISKSGHDTPIEKPYEFASAVLEFLKSLKHNRG